MQVVTRLPNYTNRLSLIKMFFNLLKLYQKSAFVDKNKTLLPKFKESDFIKQMKKNSLFGDEAEP